MSWFMAEKPCFSIGIDTLSKGQYITESQTLISKGGIFELGFFKPGSNSFQDIYLGIWYRNFRDKTVVWVANREKPLSNIPGFKLEVVPNGNLGLYHDLDSFWSTSLRSTLPETVEAVLLDDGNLVLRDGSSPYTVFWQSFDHPTHTWLPGALLGFNKITGRTLRLASWKSTNDPSPGLFTLEISHDHNFSFFLVWNMSTVYWTSGAWNGVMFGLVPQLSYLKNFIFPSKENGSIRYSVLNHNVFSMLLLDPSGDLKQLTSLRNPRNWSASFELPKKYIFGFCGGFGIFSENALNPCRCLQGFARSSERENDWSSGCSRKSVLHCEHSDSAIVNKDGFLRISDVKFPADPISHSAQTAKDCLLGCQLDCSCTAYAFNHYNCSLWHGALLNLQNVSNSQGNAEFMYIKLAASELQTSKG